MNHFVRFMNLGVRLASCRQATDRSLSVRRGRCVGARPAGRSRGKEYLASKYGLGMFALLILAAASVVGAAENPHSIVNSKHNLSASGPGEIRSSTEGEICVFCHAPHSAAGQTPLWNHRMPAAVYEPYTSSSLKATVGQPTGASKLCLSCHDGTVALGMVTSRSTPIPMRGGTSALPSGRSRVGTDLSAHHPISFTYDTALATAKGELRDPSTLQQQVRVDKLRQMQCTSCHDPHSDQYGKFLVQDNTASALCVQCHVPNQWSASAHATSPANWNGTGRNPWPYTSGTTVAANGCENCHTPHHAGTKAQLLKFTPVEQNCFTCHDGNVAAKDVRKEFDKLSTHPVLTTSGLHDVVEDPVNSQRHTACVDCHNPHAVQPSSSSSPSLPGALVGVKGMNSAGRAVTAISREVELCYRCHADSLGRGPARVSRQFVETNVRLEFSPASASFHPIETAGKNPSVPSLITPWTTASVMTCHDCHNNNQGPGTGGTGPKGPHGSSYPPILERQLMLTDATPESYTIYALCYKCHDRNSILSDASFSEHRKHIVEVRTACTTCHDPHGVTSKTHLINFNTIYVTPSSNGRLEYVDQGTFRGNCSLTCHGEDHRAESYP